MTENRREFLKRAALAGAAGLGALTIAPRSGRAAMGKGPDTISVGANGSYETVALARENIRLAVVQTRVRGIRIANHRADIKSNLEHMLEAIDNVFHFGAGADIVYYGFLLLMAGVPVFVWIKWTRASEATDRSDVRAAE